MTLQSNSYPLYGDRFHSINSEKIKVSFATCPTDSNFNFYIFLTFTWSTFQLTQYMIHYFKQIFSVFINVTLNIQ